MAGIVISLDLVERVNVFGMGALGGSWQHSIPLRCSRQEKALREIIAEGVI
jgi:hypothetical protein